MIQKGKFKMVFKQYIWTGCLFWSLNLVAVLKECHDSRPLGKQYNLNLKYITKNIYKVPELLKINIATMPVYLSNNSYMADTKKYRAALQKVLFPDLCLRWINPVVKHGLFTNEDISQGQLIGEYLGEIVFSDSMTNTDFAFKLPVTIDNRVLSIDAKNYGNELRFANHSDRPNVRANFIVVNGQFRLVFVAKKNIKAGQQLFINYGSDYWHTPLAVAQGRKKIKLD
jgi:SET domain-containing protein